jgi:hypothetical protein
MLTNQQIEELADECLNDLALKIQNRLGQEHGDNAGIFFSDDSVRNQIEEYIRYEISHLTK